MLLPWLVDALRMQPSLGRSLRTDFPLLEQRVWDDKPLVYLDSAATSQKPRSVLDLSLIHI